MILLQKSPNNKICPICGKDIGRNKVYCSKACRTEGSRNYKTCVICGKRFWSPPSAGTKTCGRECEKVLRHENGLSAGIEKAYIASMFSPNSGKFPENAMAKSWVIQSPDGVIYNIDNLKLWSEQNAEMLPSSPLRFADGIRRIKVSLTGKRAKNCSYQYRGWHLLSWSEENNLRVQKGLPPRKKPNPRKEKLSDEKRLEKKRAIEKERWLKRQPDPENARFIGSIQNCARCGKEYILSGSNQKYCSECSSIVREERGKAGLARLSKRLKN